MYVREPGRAGLRDDTIAMPARTPSRCASTRSSPPRPGRRACLRRAARRAHAGQLFADYCAEREIGDPRVADLFAQLHDEVTATDGAADSAELSPAN